MKPFSFPDQYKQSFGLESKCVIFFKYIKVCEKKSKRHKTFHDPFPFSDFKYMKITITWYPGTRSHKDKSNQVSICGS